MSKAYYVQQKKHGDNAQHWYIFNREHQHIHIVDCGPDGFTSQEDAQRVADILEAETRWLLMHIVTSIKVSV